MSKATKSKMPKPVRVPPHAASGLEDEITAQPRLPADEVGSSSGGEAGLSLEPEDMGTRWLSEATEQGEAVPHRLLDSELNLTTGPETDAALSSANFENENTLWEQTVDLVAETKGAAEQLRGPVALTDDSGLSEQELAPDEPRDRTVTDASVLEFSLLDDVSESGDDTIAPGIQSEEAGRHARTTSWHAPGGTTEGKVRGK